MMDKNWEWRIRLKKDRWEKKMKDKSEEWRRRIKNEKW